VKAKKTIKAKTTKKPLCVRYAEVLRLRQILQSQLSKSPASRRGDLCARASSN
jgi:hypothetical protein